MLFSDGFHIVSNKSIQELNEFCKKYDIDQNKIHEKNRFISHIDVDGELKSIISQDKGICFVETNSNDSLRPLIDYAINY